MGSMGQSSDTVMLALLWANTVGMWVMVPLMCITLVRGHLHRHHPKPDESLSDAEFDALQAFRAQNHK